MQGSKSMEDSTHRWREKLPFKLYITFCQPSPEAALLKESKVSHMPSLMCPLTSKEKDNPSSTASLFSSPIGVITLAYFYSNNPMNEMNSNGNSQSQCQLIYLQICTSFLIFPLCFLSSQSCIFVHKYFIIWLIL